MDASSQNEFLRQVTVALSSRLSKPTTDRPSVRCLSRSTLYQLLAEVQQELDREGSRRRIPYAKLLEFLEGLNVLRLIPLAAPPSGRRSIDIYVAEFGASENVEVSPLELLVAAVPGGVICYYTALSFHGLTTQIPLHHHIARLRPDTEPDRTSSTAAPRTRQAEKGKTRRHSLLGSILFTFRGVSYYCTARSPDLLRAYDTRHIGSQTLATITTIEQTLLDTLHKPVRCGGPAVVLEAWEEAFHSGRLNQKKLADLLTNLDYAKTTRRVGYLFDRCGWPVAPPMRKTLAQAGEAIDRKAQPDPIPLLPDYEGGEYDAKWHLTAPL